MDANLRKVQNPVSLELVIVDVSFKTERKSQTDGFPVCPSVILYSLTKITLALLDPFQAGEESDDLREKYTDATQCRMNFRWRDPSFIQ